MKAQVIKEKSDKELLSLIKENKETLKKLRFSLANRQLKNVKEISVAKKTIARAKTFLRARSLNK